MLRDARILAVALALAPMLCSCASISPATTTDGSGVSEAQFEAEVENGFGPLDILPPGWAVLPAEAAGR
jgi:hypothetical protein